MSSQVGDSSMSVLAISDPAYGNPSLDEATFAWEGRVRTLLFKNIPIADVLIEDIPCFAVLTGGFDFGHLGWQLALVDLDGDGSSELLASSPLASHEQGEVVAYSNAGSEGAYCLIIVCCPALPIVCRDAHRQRHQHPLRPADCRHEGWQRLGISRRLFPSLQYRRCIDGWRSYCVLALGLSASYPSMHNIVLI
jgi:hypothetical protein